MNSELHIKEIVSALSELECNDNSCLFTRRSRMGTNGGCRCIRHLPNKLRLSLEKLWWAYKKEEK